MLLSYQKKKKNGEKKGGDSTPSIEGATMVDVAKLKLFIYLLILNKPPALNRYKGSKKKEVEPSSYNPEENKLNSI